MYKYTSHKFYVQFQRVHGLSQAQLWNHEEPMVYSLRIPVTEMWGRGDLKVIVDDNNRYSNTAKAIFFMSFLCYVKRIFLKDNSVNILLWGKQSWTTCLITISILDLLASRIAVVYCSWHEWLLFMSPSILQKHRIYNVRWVSQTALFIIPLLYFILD